MAKQKKQYLRPGFTKCPHVFFTDLMPMLEKRRRGAFLFYLLVLRETIGSNHKWSSQLSGYRISLRLGWSEGSVKRILGSFFPKKSDWSEGDEQEGDYLWRRAVDVVLRGRGLGTATAHSYVYQCAMNRAPARDFTSLPHVLIDEFVGVIEQRRRGASLVFLLIWHETVGRNREWFALSGRKIAERIGWPRSTVLAILKWLEEETTLLVREREGEDFKYQVDPKIVDLLVGDRWLIGGELVPLPFVGDYLHRRPGVDDRDPSLGHRRPGVDDRDPQVDDRDPH